MSKENIMEEYEDDLTIYPFADRTTFAMDSDLIDFELVDRMTYDAEPSSREYRRMMKDLKISGRNKKKYPRWRDDYEY